MPRYRVNRSGSLIGTYYNQGAIVTLTEAQPRYFLPPHDDRIEEVQPVAAKPVSVAIAASTPSGRGAKSSALKG